MIIVGGSLKSEWGLENNLKIYSRGGMLLG